jgi:hypothetical protein
MLCLQFSFVLESPQIMVLNPNSPKFLENKLTPCGKHGFYFPLNFVVSKVWEKKNQNFSNYFQIKN